MVGSRLIGLARYIYRREIMKEIIFTDPSKGYEIEVTYKNGDKSSKFFTINQLQKATNLSLIHI